MLGQLICLGTIAEVVDGNAAAEIDVLERVPGLAMNRDEVLPHAPESFGEWLDVGRLRADVNVNTANVDQIGFLETTPKRCEDF